MKLPYLLLPLLIFLTSSDSFAFPIDSFESLFTRAQKKGLSADPFTAYSPNSLGKTFAVTVNDGGAWDVNVTREKGATFKVAFLDPKNYDPQKSGALELSLIWDGDRLPFTTSPSGLGCLNLLADRSSVFIVEDLEVKVDCPNKDVCASLEVELTAFNANDPTGQMFSSGTIKRDKLSGVRNLYIPFTQLLKDGLTGAWDVTCLGAIVLKLKISGAKSAEFAVRSIRTNGMCSESCFVPPLPTVTETPTPSPTLNVTATPTPEVEVSPSPTVTVKPTTANTATPTIEPTPTETPTAIPTIKPTRREKSPLIPE